MKRASRFLAALAAVLLYMFAMVKAAGKGLFSAFLPSVPPAPTGDDNDDEVPRQKLSDAPEDLISLGHALVLKRACAAVAAGQRPDATALKKVHPALAAWVGNLTREEAKAVAGATCGQIRHHLTGNPCLEGVPNAAEAHLRATHGLTTGGLTDNQALAVVACCKRISDGRAAGTLPISRLPAEARLWLCTITDAEAAQAAKIQPAELRAHLSGQAAVDGLPSLDVARQRHQATKRQVQADDEKAMRTMAA